MAGCIDEVPGTLSRAIGEGNDGYAVALTGVCHSVDSSKFTKFKAAGSGVKVEEKVYFRTEDVLNL